MPAPTIKVRIAEPADCEAIAKLYLELTGDNNIRVDPNAIAELRDNTTNRLYVAEVDGTICGTLFVTICLDPMYGDQPFAVLENIVVGSLFKGRGIGSALLLEAENYCRAARCTKTMLLSNKRREQAHQFFSKQGYEGELKKGFVKYLNRAP